MKMTLKDCIELPVFCGAEVLTKKIDLVGKKVRGISVMEDIDVVALASVQNINPGSSNQECFQHIRSE